MLTLPSMGIKAMSHKTTAYGAYKPIWKHDVCCIM